MKPYALALAILAVPQLSAQERAVPTEPIVTDRPDFTESSVVVPRGWLQIETGATHQTERGLRSTQLGEVLLRYGIARNSELRLGLPSYIMTTFDGRTFRGFGDTYVGFKLQLGPVANGDDVALIPGATIPTGARDFRAARAEPELKLCWSRGLSDDWTIAAMGFVLWSAVGTGHELVYQQTLALSRPLSERTGFFVEYAGNFTRLGSPEHVAHLGFTFLPTPDSMFDIHGGFTLNGADRRPFIALGYSFRF